MCDCITKGTERLKEKIESQLKEKDSGFISLDKADYANRVLMLEGGDNRPPVALDFKIEYTREFKNGKIKTKKDSFNVLPTFCPFCGEKYN